MVSFWCEGYLWCLIITWGRIYNSCIVLWRVGEFVFENIKCASRRYRPTILIYLLWLLCKMCRFSQHLNVKGKPTVPFNWWAAIWRKGVDIWHICMGYNHQISGYLHILMPFILIYRYQNWVYLTHLYGIQPPNIWVSLNNLILFHKRGSCKCFAFGCWTAFNISCMVMRQLILNRPWFNQT